jgi:hypothetical protein
MRLLFGHAYIFALAATDLSFRQADPGNEVSVTPGWLRSLRWVGCVLGSVYGRVCFFGELGEGGEEGVGLADEESIGG